MTIETSMRSQDEIFARIEEINDPFGWSIDLLLEYLDFEHAAPLLKDGVTSEEWGEPSSDPRADLIDYLDFAWKKALDERGISASRSVDKIGQWLWLMGDKDLLDEFQRAEYADYGRPQLLVVTKALAPEKVPSVEELI